MTIKDIPSQEEIEEIRKLLSSHPIVASVDIRPVIHVLTTIDASGLDDAASRIAAKREVYELEAQLIDRFRHLRNLVFATTLKGTP